MKKRIAFIVILLTMCMSVFCEITWLELTEDMKKDYSAIAVCTKKSEALEVTHVADLQPYFISYRNGELQNNNDYSIYIVYFSALGFLVEEYMPHSKNIAMYAKTIFQ